MARPYVLLNMAPSLDGKIAPAPTLRRPGPFVMSRGTVDAARMLAIRARADAILVGAGNVRSDDPDLALDGTERARRRAAGAREPLRVVATRTGEGLSSSLQMFDASLGGPAIVAHTQAMKSATRALLAPVAELALFPGADIDVAALLAWLADTHGCRTVLAEGGAALNTALFAARAVDEVFLTIVPRVLGGTTAPGIVAGAGFAPDAIPDATLVSVEQAGDEIFLRYRFAWSAS